MISDFLGGLHVEQLRTTRIFEITYTAADPVFAQRAANAVATQYITQSKDIRSEATQEANDYLSRALDEQRTKLNDSETKLAEYKVSHNAVALDDKVNTVSAKLADISARLTKAQIETIDKEAAYQGLKAVQGDREKLAANPVILANPGDPAASKNELSALHWPSAREAIAGTARARSLLRRDRRHGAGRRAGAGRELDQAGRPGRRGGARPNTSTGDGQGRPRSSSSPPRAEGGRP